jgi:hypothetical protein
MSHNKQHTKNSKGSKNKNYKKRHKKNSGGNPWDGAEETIPTPPVVNKNSKKKKTNTKMKVKKNG